MTLWQWLQHEVDRMGPTAVGLFVVVFAVLVTVFAVWLANYFSRESRLFRAVNRTRSRRRQAHNTLRSTAGRDAYNEYEGARR